MKIRWTEGERPISSTSLLLQLIVILATARSCGWLLRFLGHPGVVGEMVAGLLLGPVAFGALFTTLHAQLFSKKSLDGLTSLSTVGPVLIMFIVGLELRAHEGVTAQIQVAGYVGVFSVSLPLALGTAVWAF
jgi:Kef-type K+ transport system membrane component KefB